MKRIKSSFEVDYESFAKQETYLEHNRNTEIRNLDAQINPR